MEKEYQKLWDAGETSSERFKYLCHQLALQDEREYNARPDTGLTLDNQDLVLGGYCR